MELNGDDISLGYKKLHPSWNRTISNLTIAWEWSACWFLCFVILSNFGWHSLQIPWLHLMYISASPKCNMHRDHQDDMEIFRAERKIPGLRFVAEPNDEASWAIYTSNVEAFESLEMVHNYKYTCSICILTRWWFHFLKYVHPDPWGNNPI